MHVNRYFYRILAALYFCVIFTAQANNTISYGAWEKPVPIFKQKYDWVGLTSDEWLKGEIIAMYDEELEFDSDEMGIQIIDMKDISELRSKGRQSVRLENGFIIEGYVVIRQGRLTVKNTVETINVPVIELLSIASSTENERDLWDGKVTLSANIRGGNSEQFDYNFYTELQRRTSTSRFKSTFTADFSESKNQETGKNEEIAKSQRLTGYYDWFFTQKVFFRALDFEYFSDEFQNVEHRYTLGSSLGYHVVDSKKTTWDVTLGPSYQRSSFSEVNVSARNESYTEDESSVVILLSSDYEYEITKDIDFELYYQVKFVKEEAGEYIHHLTSSLEIELINDFDLELSYIVDRTEKPLPNEDGSIPKKEDYRILVGLSYSF